ncbi:MAG: bifunctional ornithine acetyltransferase/N-acetylglutamate synthase [Firmicutes bacterium]|nr:bifunctional ornithine acetyltransferase/N-acetylglutamate synthase [Bacillota bacterium]
MEYKVIEGGGITSPKGFTAGAVYVGVKSRKTQKPDVAVLYSETEASCAAVFTTNKFCAAPVILDREILKNGKARAIVINSGNANAATGTQGIEDARTVEREAEKLLGVGENEVFVCSTGVIGQKLPVEKVLDGVRQIIPAKLDAANGSDAAYAIMTTDTVRKESAYELELSSGTIRIGAMAKGSGMIHPNMATTLAYVTTDAKCDSADLQKMLHNAIDKSFNMCTVDGDTSTNDTMILLANGASGVEVKTEEDKAALAGLIEHICIDMARRIASDGEGATHLIVVESYGLPTEHDARLVAKAIAGSTLFKAAVFGRDANWGRIMAAAGYSGADVDPTKADCIIKSSAGEVQVMKDGFGTDFSEELAKAVLTEHDITVIVDFHSGDGKAVAYGCDLTYEYVKINGDYRT